MPTTLQADTLTVLAALATYRADYAATGHVSNFPSRTVHLSEGAVVLQPLASHVCAFAQGYRMDGPRRIDRGVAFSSTGDKTTDTRLARTIAHRAHLIVRERAART